MKAIEWVDKPTVKDFRKKFNTRDPVDNTTESWDEVTPSNLKCLGKYVARLYLWHCKFFSNRKSTSNLVTYVVTLAKNVEFEEIIEEDVIQLLVSWRERLHENLMLLVKRTVETMEVPLKPFKLSKQLALTDWSVQVFFIKNDPNPGRKIKITEEVYSELSSYFKLLLQRWWCHKQQHWISSSPL